uniref:Trigger factor ribosome-binding bacterial domain-containing protein n=1 Tax=Kalanchoe fedtschenkoi TaxID=63787 RepID=A0A7N0TKR1_KALFE
MLRLNNLLCVPQNKLVLCASSHSSHTKSPSSLKLCYKQLEFSTRKSLALPRMYAKCCASASAASSDVVTTGNSAFDHITVATTRESGSKELKISVVVSGAKTQSIFDDVFSKIVADSQPIPGFRRVKGGRFFELYMLSLHALSERTKF